MTRLSPSRRLTAWLLGLCLGALLAYLAPSLGWHLFLAACGGQ